MRHSSCWVSVVCLLALGVDQNAQGETLLEQGLPTESSAKQWEGFDRVQDDPLEPGKKVFVVGKGEQTVLSTERFVPSADATYTLTISAKAAVAGEGTKLWAGLVPYDENGDMIAAQTINPVADTGTELTEDCFEDDTVICVKNGANWGEGRLRYVAFEADNSGKLSDLPNRTLSNPGILKVEDKTTFWEITLANPVGRAYAAGTPVRLHEAGANYIYCTLVGGEIPDVAQPVSGTVSGFSTTPEGGRFWPGTASFGVVIFKDELSQGEAYIEGVSLEK